MSAYFRFFICVSYRFVRARTRFVDIFIAAYFLAKIRCTLVVTIAMLLRLLNCRFIITIYCYYYYYYTKVYEVTLYGGNK